MQQTPGVATARQGPHKARAKHYKQGNTPTNTDWTLNYAWKISIKFGIQTNDKHNEYKGLEVNSLEVVNSKSYVDTLQKIYPYLFFVCGVDD